MSTSYPFKCAIPSGSHCFASRQYKGGKKVTPFAIELKGKIGVSDNKLMGVLAALGHDPISDDPMICDGRCWWFFEDDHQDTIRKRILAYYANWNGDVAHLSFVRHSFERAHGFAETAKQAKEKSFNRQSLSIRRL